MNQNFYNYDSSGSDQFPPPQYSDVHQPPKEISIKELRTMMQSYYEMMSQRSELEAILLQKQAAQKEQELLAQEHAVNSSKPSPVSYFYNDNISTPSTTYNIHLTKSATIITNPFEPTRRIYHNHDIFYDGDDDEELFPDENLVPTLSESEDLSKDLSDIKRKYDVPVCDDLTTFSNPLFDSNDDFTSSDDKSFSDEDVPKEIYSNPLFDKEIISTKIAQHHFNAESDLIESLLNRDTSIISSHIDLIPLGINEADFDPEEEIRLVEKLLYDNSSPRPPEEFNFGVFDAVIESFS
ncbi:hypothetical protein Tco_1007581 [Tanacetum coccineum]